MWQLGFNTCCLLAATISCTNAWFSTRLLSKGLNSQPLLIRSAKSRKPVYNVRSADGMRVYAATAVSKTAIIGEVTGTGLLSSMRDRINATTAAAAPVMSPTGSSRGAPDIVENLSLRAIMALHELGTDVATGFSCLFVQYCGLIRCLPSYTDHTSVSKLGQKNGGSQSRNCVTVRSSAVTLPLVVSNLESPAAIIQMCFWEAGRACY